MSILNIYSLAPKAHSQLFNVAKYSECSTEKLVRRSLSTYIVLYDFISFFIDYRATYMYMYMYMYL